MSHELRRVDGNTRHPRLLNYIADFWTWHNRLLWYRLFYHPEQIQKSVPLYESMELLNHLLRYNNSTEQQHQNSFLTT